MNMKLTLSALSIAASLTMVGCGGGGSSSSNSVTITDTQKTTALTAYADYAFDKYTAAKDDAVAMQTALTTMVFLQT